MTWTPHATVAVIVEDEAGRFLMVEEVSGGRVVFNQPAGHVEENEAILDAVRRETLEETGWQVEPCHFLGVYTYKAPANGVTYYRFCYAAKALRRVSSTLDDGIVAAHWMALDDIRSLGDRLRSPMVLRCIEDYRNGRRYPLDVVVDTQA
ncbi:NUDIX hydrolase [Marinobacter lutaoensis]|jgi:8-oxo-dGTP pyrophosphatase MutT (NUDIX family)|uniref:Phosphatase NudJ n=1 Tax=Marinobacter lutaoensis TaxID=135739 RepID=A0A1V2DXF4_9GAMM|nr:NUDIX hydrolase [Marinobacter lutaoensis]MBE02659.1 NUDIX hydrolase [Marinobacter sp.]MBI42671.1 NUDIX hydrolase [Oceanospirillales bacterium]NVD35391.1 NUDIX hydrolase [Marinobacter lutaoensis]ONF45348.1 NUDIX hydrolase [Marinobacter lutaoensis]|tara:strand:- start:1126 stop:1575 length:450 start_codon:yes stop_codon:yes gene_type:complete